MEKYVIVGGKRLSGTIRLSGGKNAVLTILPACLLSKGVCIIHDVPRLSDVYVMKEVWNAWGQGGLSGNTMTVNVRSGIVMCRTLNR